MRTSSAALRRWVMLSAAVAAGVGAAVLPARGDTATWDGSSDATWDNPDNWTFGLGTAGEPTSGDDVLFPASLPGSGSVLTLTDGEQARSLAFNNSYTLNGGTLANAAGTVTVAPTFSAVLNTNLGGASGLTLPTVADGGGGTVELKLANSFTGNVAVQGGTLNVLGQGSADPTLLGAGAKAVTLTNGGRLQVTGMLGAATGGFDPTGGTKTFVVGTGGGTIDVGNAANVSVTLNDTGQFSGAGLLTKAGPGTLTLGQNSVGYTGFTGGARVEAGTLSLNNTNALGGVATSAIALAGGNLNLRFDSSTDFKNNVTVASAATIDVNRNNTSSTNATLTLGTLSIGAQTLTASGGNGYALAFGNTTLTGDATIAAGTGTPTVTLANVGQSGGTFGLTKSGANLLVLTGTGTYGGNTVATGGTLRAAAANSLPAAGNLSLNNTVFETIAAFNRGVGEGAGEVQVTGGTAGFSARGAAVVVNLGGATPAADLSWGSATFNPSTLVLNAATADNAIELRNGLLLNGTTRTVQVNANTATISGAIANGSGAAGLTKNGVGTLVLANEANAYTGNTTVSGGTLVVNNLAAGPTSSVGAGNLVLAAGGVLRYTGPTVTTTRVGATGTNIAATIDVTDAAADLTLNGAVNSVTVTKLGPGTMSLTGGADNSSGNLNVQNGTVVLGKASTGTVHAAAQVNAVAPGATLRLAGTGGDQVYDAAGATRGVNNMNGTFDLNGRSESLHQLTGYGTVTNNDPAAATSTLSIGHSNGTSAFAGRLTDGAGGGKTALTKIGTGTLTLNNAHAYTGATTVSGGTLRLAYSPDAPVANAAIWLDAADASTLTVDGSNRVSAWNDKGAGPAQNAAQANAARQPTRVTSTVLGGPSQTVLRFDGGDDLMNVDLTSLSGSGYTIFAVEGRRSSKSSNYYIGTAGSSNNNALHVGYRDNTNFTFAQYGNDMNAGVPAYEAQQFRLWTTEFAPAGTTSLTPGHYTFLDGAQVASTTNTTALTVNAANVGQVGGGRQTSESFAGDLAEVLVYTAALSPAERVEVERYLQAKWFGGGVTDGNVLPSATAVTIAAGATLDVGPVRQAIASLSSAAPTAAVTIGAAGSLTVGDASDAEFRGTITGDGSLAKQGSGTLTLTGANAYAGPTTINAGRLIVGAGGNGSLTGAGPVTVLADGTLGGSGTVAGGVNSFGRIAPGGAGLAGTLTLTSFATVNNGSALEFDLDAPDVTAGTGGNDLLAALGNAGSLVGDLNLGAGVVVTILPGASFGEGEYHLIQYAGTVVATGGGPLDLSGWTVAGPAADDYTYAFSNDPAGKSINLTVSPVPEPATAGLAAAIGAGLLLRRRRRRPAGCRGS